MDVISANPPPSGRGRREAQARQGEACVPSMFSSSEVKVFYPT